MSVRDHINDAADIGFWRELNPDLSISDDLLSTDAGEPYGFDADTPVQCKQQYDVDGYFQSHPAIPREECQRLADAIVSVTDLGFPAIFCLVYDEFWNPLRRLQQLLTPLMGEGYRLLPDFWFYNVRTSDDDSGWAPHRDLQFPNPVDKEGKPNVLNLWIPLTDATTMNGCMYMLPASRDPEYPKDYSSLIGHDLRGLKELNASMLQNYRALPADAGSVLGWNQFVFHWGSRSSRLAPHPRINYSMYVQRGDIEAYDDLAIELNGNNDYQLSFEMRIGIISRSLWQYRMSPNLQMDEMLIRFAEINHSHLNGRGYKPLVIQRSDPCWCGSGIRFKNCHGVQA